MRALRCSSRSARAALRPRAPLARPPWAARPLPAPSLRPPGSPAGRRAAAATPEMHGRGVLAALGRWSARASCLLDQQGAGPVGSAAARPPTEMTGSPTDSEMSSASTPMAEDTGSNFILASKQGCLEDVVTTPRLVAGQRQWISAPTAMRRSA